MFLLVQVVFVILHLLLDERMRFIKFVVVVHDQFQLEILVAGSQQLTVAPELVFEGLPCE